MQAVGSEFTTAAVGIKDSEGGGGIVVKSKALSRDLQDRDFCPIS